MKLRIIRRTQPGWLLWLLTMLPFFLSWLPAGAKFLADFSWAALVVYLLRFRQDLDWRKLRWLPVWIVAFLGLTFAVFLVRKQSGLYYLWGVRNNFRFYAAFLAAALFLTQEDAQGFFRLLDRLFWADILLSLVQFYGFGLKGDYLGGLFGWVHGCNGYTNLFFAIVITKSVVSYLQKKERFSICAVKCTAALYVAALAELKFFFVEFGVIVLMAVLFSGLSWRKLWFLLGGCGVAVLFAALLETLFPQFEGWFSPTWILETAVAKEGYASAGDLNRLTAISGINRRIFRSWDQRMFGLGLGNCDGSEFALLTTDFYQRYSHLHYSWMSVSFVYLETGYLGLIFFFGFFALVYSSVGRAQKRGGDPICCMTGKILAVLCMMIGIYNSSLRTEAGYLAYIALALPFARTGEIYENTVLGRNEGRYRP